jgi:hypothetical protein
MHEFPKPKSPNLSPVQYKSVQRAIRYPDEHDERRELELELLALKTKVDKSAYSPICNRVK